MVRGVAVVFVAACATRAAAPPAPPSPPVRAHAPLAAPSPAICLAPTTDVTRVGGDARDVHACFGATCVAIDRHTGAATSWAPPRDDAPQAADVRIAVDGGSVQVCLRDSWCRSFARNDVFDRDSIHVERSDDGARMLVTVIDPRGIDPAAFEIFDGHIGSRAIELVPGDGNHCGAARFLAREVLVTTDDCEGGVGRGYVFDLRGHLLGSLEPETRKLDARDATIVSAGRSRSAVLLPWSYAVEIVEPLLARRDVIDLVPIQAESSAHPTFAIARAADGSLVVASPTGGLGVIDPTSGTLASSWIVPRCEARE